MKLFNKTRPDFNTTLPDQDHVQQILSYCESRFRSALTVIANKKPQSKRLVLQVAIEQEVEYALYIVGLAAAIGYVVNVGLITRSLATNAALRSPADEIYYFERDFLLNLDAEVPLEHPEAIVSSYHLQWWASKADPAEDGILSRNTINACMDHHKDVKERSSRTHRPANILREEVRGVDARTPEQLAAEFVQHQKAHGDCPAAITCSNCQEYRTLVFTMLDSYTKLYGQIQGYEVSVESQANLLKRQLAFTHSLSMAALAKEDEMQDPVPQSTKWTSGPTLTQRDVLEVARSGRKKILPPHSGYLTSLPEGSLPSATSSRPDSEDFQCLPAFAPLEDQTMAALPDDQDVSHFEIFPLRHIHEGIDADVVSALQRSMAMRPLPPTGPEDCPVGGSADDVNPKDLATDSSSESSGDGEDVHPTAIADLLSSDDDQVESDKDVDPKMMAYDLSAEEMSDRDVDPQALAYAASSDPGTLANERDNLQLPSALPAHLVDNDSDIDPRELAAGLSSDSDEDVNPGDIDDSSDEEGAGRPNDNDDVMEGGLFAASSPGLPDSFLASLLLGNVHFHNEDPAGSALGQDSGPAPRVPGRFTAASFANLPDSFFEDDLSSDDER